LPGSSSSSSSSSSRSSSRTMSRRIDRQCRVSAGHIWHTQPSICSSAERCMSTNSRAYNSRRISCKCSVRMPIPAGPTAALSAQLYDGRRRWRVQQLAAGLHYSRKASSPLPELTRVLSVNTPRVAHSFIQQASTRPLLANLHTHATLLGSSSMRACRAAAGCASSIVTVHARRVCRAAPLCQPAADDPVALQLVVPVHKCCCCCC
jgi:hypothetical protein